MKKTLMNKKDTARHNKHGEHCDRMLQNSKDFLQKDVFICGGWDVPGTEKDISAA